MEAAKLCDAFLAAVCRTDDVFCYSEVEHYLQDPRAPEKRPTSMVDEYVEQAKGCLLLDAAELAKHACKWMDVDSCACSSEKASQQLRKQYRLLQLLEFDAKESSLAMADRAVSTYHLAVSMLKQPTRGLLIEDADPASDVSTASTDVVSDEDEAYESIECDAPPAGWEQVPEASANQAIPVDTSFHLHPTPKCSCNFVSSEIQVCVCHYTPSSFDFCR